MTRDRAWADQPLWRYALIGSALLHLALFAWFTQIRLPAGPSLPSLRARPIPVELFTPARPKPATVLPRAQPKPPPKPVPIPAVEPPKPIPAPRLAAPRPRPAPSLPSPAPSLTPKPSHASPPSGGGGRVGLGTLAPGGDLPVAPGAGAGGTPVGAVPGAGTGSGSGTGPGKGEGPPGTAEPKPNPVVAPPPPPPPKSEVKPPEHHSTLADRANPELVQRVNPTYPLSAKEDGVEGTVQLRVRVESDGSVGAVHVTKSAGDSRLDDAAIAAVKHWKYKPAVQNGVPRAVDTSASVTFRLQ